MFTNDVLLDIEPYLDYKDFVNLSLTCKDMDSLVNDVAKQIVTKYQSADEEKSLRKYDESWIKVLNKLHLLRLPLTFDQLIGDKIKYTAYKPPSIISNLIANQFHIVDSVTVRNHTRSINDRPVEFTGYPNTAISNHIMRGGKHYATFTANVDLMAYCWFGVMRPIKGLDKKQGLNEFFPVVGNHLLANQTNNKWDSDVHCCLYDCYEGECTWSDGKKAGPYHVKDWSGIEGSLKPEPGESCKVGLYLDLDEGRLIVYKNDKRLGIMKAGLRGEYCWAASIVTHFESCVVRIERGSVLGAEEEEERVWAQQKLDEEARIEAARASFLPLSINPQSGGGKKKKGKKGSGKKKKGRK